MKIIQIIKSNNSLSTKKFLFLFENEIGISFRYWVSDVGYWLMKKSRKLFRLGCHRCSWCGRNMGFSMSVSRNGCRCMTSSRCEEFDREATP